MVNREIAEHIFDRIRNMGYKPYDIDYDDGYFIFEMGKDSVVYFKLKGVWKSWKFGMWINAGNMEKTDEITEKNRNEHLVIQLFCQNEDWLDKFKPSRSALLTELDREQLNDEDIDFYVGRMLKMIKKHPILCYNEYCGRCIGYADYSFLWSFIETRTRRYWSIVKEKVVCSFWLTYTKLKLQLAKHDKIIESVRIYDFEKENNGWTTSYKYRPLPTFVDGATKEQIAGWYDKWFHRDQYGKFGWSDYVIDVEESFYSDMSKFQD
jgi:hypothetical protein